MDDPPSPDSSDPLRLSAVVLAAGQGTRMKSSLPKVLHVAAGRTLIDHALAALGAMAPSPTPVGVVLGDQAERVKQHLPPGMFTAIQEPQRGTADAVLRARPLLEGAAAAVLVVYADVPLITPASLGTLFATHSLTGAVVTLLTMSLEDAGDYGRVVRSPDGTVTRITEAREANTADRAVREANTGIGVFADGWLWGALDRLSPSAATGELYLTDLVGLAVADGVRVAAVSLDDPREGQGVNTRTDLGVAEAVLRARIRGRHLENGVTMMDPESTWIDGEVEIGRDTVIWPDTYLLGRTEIGEGCVLGPGAHISDSRLADGATVRLSLVEGSELGQGCTVGPFAHLRSGVQMAAGSRAGTHAELKNATLGEGARVPHFSYVGDAAVGAGANIGAGTVTANFDGVAKHRTEIGDGAFVGSGTMLVAPVKIGAGARTGAGSVVTEDVAAGVTVVGVPARPTHARSPEQNEAGGEDGTPES